MTTDTTAGAVLTVQVKPGYGRGSKLYLAHGLTDGGDDIADWSDRLELASSVPAEGGTYTVDLVANDLATGRVFRVFAGDEYTPLARVQQNSADDLIDTGIRDTTIWGCAYGHYCTGSTGNYSAFLGSGNGDKLENPGFRISLGGNKYKMAITTWGYGLYTYKYFDLNHDVCNDFKLTNNTMSYNGKSLLPEVGSGLWRLMPMGSSGKTFYMGNLAGASTCDNYGWWYYLTLEDRDGKKLLDYVPVKNAAGTAGFFDRVTGAFVTPMNGGALVAGEVKAAAKVMATPLSGTLSADPQLPLTAMWHGGAGGDLNVAANWACTNAFGAELANTLPRAGVTAATFVGPVGFSAATAEAVIWGRSIFVDGSLAADCDWRGLRGDMIDGFLDLAGHSLALTGFPAVGEFTSSTEGDAGELHVTVAEGKTINNTGVSLSGNLRFVKEGPGLFIATKSPQTYTGGNDILAGTLKCGVLGNVAADGHVSCFGFDPAIDVRIGGTLDYAGTYYWGYYTINLYGGTLLNSVRPPQYSFNPNLNLYADSFFDVAATGDLQTNSDNLNGHTLNVNLRDANWLIVNSKFKDGTVVVTGTGCFNFERSDALDCSTASFDIASQLNMNCTKGLTVSNFVVRCAEGKVTGNSLAQPLCVKGRFTPVTQTFPKIELQNGATLDLSGKDGAWSVANTSAQWVFVVTGTTALTGAGGVVADSLSVTAAGRFVFDSTRTPIKVNGDVILEEGARLALPDAYRACRRGKFTLVTFGGTLLVKGAAVSGLGTTIGGVFDATCLAATDVASVVKLEAAPDGTNRALVLTVGDYDAHAPRVKVMPLGDSITEATSKYDFYARPNYRLPLMAKLEAAGYKAQALGYHASCNANAAGLVAPVAHQLHASLSGQMCRTMGKVGGWEDSIDATLDCAGEPDFVTFKIGTNDLGSGGQTPQSAFDAWSNVVWKILRARPNAKVIATPIVNHVNSSKIADYNDRIRAYLAKRNLAPGDAGFPEGRVFAVDICATLSDDADFADSTHPSWVGHDKVAREFARAITNICVQTRGQAPVPMSYTTTSGVEANVPEAYRRGYRRVGRLTLGPTRKLANLAYSHFDESLAAASYDRVAYYMELKRRNTDRIDYHGHRRFVWADMDAFGTRDWAAVQFPKTATQQRVVSNLHVHSNDTGIRTIPPDRPGAFGFIEFWPWTYGEGPSSVADAPANLMGTDWNDVSSGSGVDYCCGGRFVSHVGNGHAATTASAPFAAGTREEPVKLFTNATWPHAKSGTYFIDRNGHTLLFPGEKVSVKYGPDNRVMVTVGDGLVIYIAGMPNVERREENGK